MFTQCKWTLIYNVVIILLLNFDATCAADSEQAIKFAGIVNKIKVYALEDGSSFESDNMSKQLKLNVSWMPPDEGRQPSSYSIVITNIPKETDVNRIECTEGSALYTIQNATQFSLLVPQNKLLNGMPELQIRPNCAYKIQVHANPRAKPVGKLPEIIYAVPKCIGDSCSCAEAKGILPVPKVEVVQANKKIIINWNVTSSSNVSSYVISIGKPLLTSKAGHSVYNITQISNVSSATNTFTWNFVINNQYIRIQSGSKIFVAATDYRGCLGTRGNFTITVTSKTSHTSTAWLLPVIATCILILGLISFVFLRAKKECRFLLSKVLRREQTMSELSTYKPQWSDETCCKLHENDEFEIPYKCINLKYELGKGQFGRVYLGNLNNNGDTLVAVKMSQCSDPCNEPEARRQLLEEIETMKTAGFHPHLVSFIGCCTSPNDPICILLEYMEGGDLLAYLHSRRIVESNAKTPLCSLEVSVSRYANVIETDEVNDEEREGLHGIIERQQFLKFALDIARGMEHLEAQGITHRDLAARNILLTSDLTLKVSDFGLSRNGVYVISNVAGKVRKLPIRWMSPEAVRDHTFSSKSDIWSFGIVLWEIGTLGSFPYPNVQDEDLLCYLTSDKYRLTCPDAISHDIYKIMCSCWSTIPQDRPSFAQLALDFQMLKEPLYSVHETSNPCYMLL